MGPKSKSGSGLQSRLGLNIESQIRSWVLDQGYIGSESGLDIVFSLELGFESQVLGFDSDLKLRPQNLSCGRVSSRHRVSSQNQI